MAGALMLTSGALGLPGNRKLIIKKPKEIITEIGMIVRAQSKSLQRKSKLPHKWDTARNKIKRRRKANGYIGETEKNKTKPRKIRKNQDIEVEHDEAHRTKRRRK
jgi:hypothetical protein